MPETKINYKPRVFDDPKFCYRIGGDHCYFMRVYKWQCALFRTKKLNKPKQLKSQYHGNFKIGIKCDECKKYYQEAKK